ncbi:MAG: type III-B CRISPR-associated protein Cas10/Cmr2 [Clostridia bacterium]|nr:type III-B CRISPR-associated protein Cas10/Cmr2 [Clostridia bacterium]
MTRHLVLVTVGPVQEFIAQARRTRDLWHGSHLLSELSRAAARALARQGGMLVVPALAPDDPELEEATGPLRPDGSPRLSIGNHILAVLPPGSDPREVAKATREAVLAYWSDVAGRVWRAVEAIVDEGARKAWDEQVREHVEFIAAWTPLDDDYRSARRRVHEMAQARKNLREFRPWRHDAPGVRRSSLDGARRSVLTRLDRPAEGATGSELRARQRKIRAKYRIQPGEELDAIGLIKRAGGSALPFVPIANVAAAAWMRHARRKAPDAWGALVSALEAWPGSDALRHGARNCCGALFPFEASIFFPSRWVPIFEEMEGPEGADAERETALRARRFGEQHVRPLLKQAGSPPSYVACLRADGDGVGAALDRLATPEANAAFSRQLSEYARIARTVVEERHLGSLVYAGGDELLAFAPVSAAPAIARELHREFDRAIRKALDTGGAGGGDVPTLSVGIGVGHVMATMADLRWLGEEALRLAKSGGPRALGGGGASRKNALAIIVDKRSGGRRTFRAGWDEWQGDPVGRLEADVKLLGAGLSRRKVHQIEDVLRRLAPAVGPWAAGSRGGASVASSADEVALKGEVVRLLSRAEDGTQQLRLEELGLDLGPSPADPRADAPVLHERLQAWVDRVLVALTIAENAPPEDEAEGAGEAAL